MAGCLARRRSPVTKGWSAPGQGTRARRAMPRHAFFRPVSRKYPYKTQRGGKWVPSRAGVASAITRAGAQGATDVIAKARRVQRRHGWLPAYLKKKK